jgi:glycosyltransferase involved in cell wall biosynthesis
MRILLVSHPPLAAELGAAQVALNLAAALRARGHEATAWSPSPLPPGIRGWDLRLRQARVIEELAAGHGPFDVIETPAITASRQLARLGRIVVRSVQPELRYLRLDIREDLARRPSPRAIVNALLGIPRAAAIVGGWRRASLILCQGSDERAWMRRRFPRWAGKLGLYVCALPPGERETLARARSQRTPRAQGPGTRFLWIGRWSSQKGTRRLLAFLRERLASHPGDALTVAGCGPAAERDLPQEWVRSGQVRIVPAFARAELPALLAGHDAGLFTSDVEGWGLSLCEMLESGLTVFATEAGAVVDLRPYFPVSLRPFPPPSEIVPGPLEDLQANGYYARFSWPEIARSWEEQVLRGAEATAR